MKPFHLIFVCIFFIQCGSKIEEIKNESGLVVEKYTIYKGTKENKKHLLLEKFDDNGKALESIEYRNGKMNGLRKIYDSGVLYSIEIRKDDLYDGPYESYYPNGNKQMEGNYTRDVLSGEVRVYYPSGKLKEIVNFSENVENGPFKEYYENGNTKAEGNYVYKDGPVEDGLLQMYDTMGVLIKKMNCKEGICQTIWKLEESK